MKGTVSVNNFPTSTSIDSGNLSIYSGNLSIYSLPAVSQSGTWYANINNFPTSTTITSGNISIYGEVEIKNDSGNALAISRNTTTNSASNPIYVAGVSSGSMGALPDTAVTAFDEPFAVNTRFVPGLFIAVNPGPVAP